MKKILTLKFKLLIGFIVFVIVITSTFFIYVGSYYKASTSAFSALKPSSLVTVDMKSDNSLIKTNNNGDITFYPRDNNKNIGFIFYPGAKVEALAYAPLAKEIASNGYTVVIAKMSFNLAILSPNRADDIIKAHKDIHTWAIGGHSLGGVIAADYAFKHDDIKALILLASYPQSNKDFKNKDIKVLSLWGSNDKVANLNKVKDAEDVMPASATFTEISGGNHGGFGDYGHQKGDGNSTISNLDQINYSSKEIVRLLDTLK